MAGNKDSPDRRAHVTSAWRTSSFSDGGMCVELAPTAEDGVAVRNSNDHSQGMLVLDRSQLQALIAGIKAGEFDDLG